MTCDTFRDNLTALGDGSLDPAEARQIQDHIATCAACRAHFEQIQAVIAALRRDKQADPGDLFFKRLNERIHAQIESSSTPVRRRFNPQSAIRNPRSKVRNLAAAAMLLLMLAGAGYFHTIPKQGQKMSGITKYSASPITAISETGQEYNILLAALSPASLTPQTETDTTSGSPSSNKTASISPDDREIYMLENGAPLEFKIPADIQDLSDEEAGGILDALNTEYQEKQPKT